MEHTGLAPENAELEAQVETAEADAEAAETESADPATAAADTGKPEPRDRVQERIDQLTREKYEAFSSRDSERYRREQAERELEALRQKQSAKPETVAPSDEFPTLESCDFDEGRYRLAIDAYYDKKFEAKAESVLQRKERMARDEQAARDWERKQAEFIKTKPEYAEKVVEAGRRGEWACTHEMAEVIRASDVGLDVSMHLAENASKSFEIARLPPVLAAFEVGQIAAQIKAAKAAPPPVSKAPPPVSKIDGTSSSAPVSTTDPSSDKLSDEDWFKAERKRVSRMNRN